MGMMAMAMFASFAESRHAEIRYHPLTGKPYLVPGRHHNSGSKPQSLSPRQYSPQQISDILKGCAKDNRKSKGRNELECRKPDRIAKKCNVRVSNSCARFWSCEFGKTAYCNSNFLIFYKKIFKDWERMKRRWDEKRRRWYWGR